MGRVQELWAMNSQHYKYVLVGGGAASSAAAEAIRARDADGTMLLVAQEVNRPYDRAALDSDYLLGKRGHEQLFTLDDQWFRRHHVDLRTGRRAARLDVHRHAVALDSGDVISFDKLLIATGGQPKHLENVPGAALPGVFYLRTIEDADRLHNAIQKALREGRPHARGRGKCVVVGAGLLGVELSATLTRLGLAVELVEAEPHAWPRFAGDVTGRIITGHLEENGVGFHGRTGLLRLEGDGRVQRAVLSDAATADADFVVPAIGIVPNKGILRGTPLAAEKAILVDAHCRTSDPGIYAAGSCAAIFDARFGKYRNIDQWGVAAVTGALAGRNMAGADEAFDVINRFDSEAFGLHLTVWGEHRLVERRIVRGNGNARNGNAPVETPDLIEFGIAADGRVAQVLAVNHRGEDGLLAEFVRRRVAVDGNAERLMDPGKKLDELLA